LSGVTQYRRILSLAGNKMNVFRMNNLFPATFKGRLHNLSKIYDDKNVVKHATLEHLPSEKKEIGSSR
jgi:hypothetical protein